MRRGGTVIALALLLSLVAAPVAAPDGTGTADVFLKERGDDYFAGEDLLSDDGDGQSRSLIVRDRLTLIVKVQNDGDARAQFTIQGSGSDEGFGVRYRLRGRDATDDVVDGSAVLRIQPGRAVVLRVSVDATDAPFASVLLLFVSATPDLDAPVDAARAEITKIS